MGIATDYTRGTLPEEANALLGKVSDAELGKRYGVIYQCVSSRRRSMGIPPLRPLKAPRSSEMIGQLGKRPDNSIAKDFGLNTNAVQLTRKRLGIARFAPPYVMTPEIKALVGTVSDMEITQRTGIKYATIGAYRRGLATLK